jgi:TonB family protein
VAAGRLSHPEIVQIYDIGPNYMVMEYVDGQPLSIVLRQGASFSVKRIVALAQRAADAIDYAHKNGIVHRDIKPGNIMLLGASGLKVMDFGVARLDNSNLTAAGTVVGSVRYMAPEQMLGEKVDGRADVFSLAAVVYELLTAQPPFPGKTITEVVSRVVRGRHVPPCEVAPRLPQRMNAVFERAFATRASDRYPRALDFARELAEAAQGVLELDVVHGPQADIPTDVNGTAVESDDGASTIAVRQAPVVRDETIAFKPEADATVVIKAEPLTPKPVAPAATAKTLIMDAPRHDRQGVLMVESDPAGASVFVDGARVGITPLPDLELKFGAHELRLEAPEREPASIVFEMRPERPLRAVTLTLAPLRSKDGSLSPGQLVTFGPDVVPPCRVSGSLPVYPAGARERGLAGAPVVEVWIGAKGEVMDLAVVESAGALLDGALLDAVSHWRFTPARVRGVPVSVRITIQHHFRP